MIKAIIFDFDGVILESADIKTKAFRCLFKNRFPEHLDQIVAYHEQHMGISRFVKFRQIYRQYAQRELEAHEEELLGGEFSNIVFKKVLNAAMVPGAQEFLNDNHRKYLLFIASGTPDAELNEIVNSRGLSRYFQKIYGSPQTKVEIVNEIKKTYNLSPSEIIFVGDAESDYEAALAARVNFIAKVSHFSRLKHCSYQVSNLNEITPIVNQLNNTPVCMKTGKESQPKKSIVFGGSGFLGSHVADVLSEMGHAVIIYDRVPSKYLRENQTMIVGDILDNAQVLKAVEGCHYVYNFAGFSDLDDASVKPIDTIHLNILGNTIIMNAALRVGAERFIYASTIYVYSEKGGFYRCSKQASELYIEEYHRSYGLNYTIMRFSTLYGPRADARNSIFRYLQQALSTDQIECGGTGEEVRDYIHVKDAARLSVEILGDNYKNRPVVISGHHPVKFRDMAAMIQEILGKDIKINYSNTPNPAHYTYTPYSFSPRVGHKLTNNLYVDMGQGLLDCLHEMHQEHQPTKFHKNNTVEQFVR